MSEVGFSKASLRCPKEWRNANLIFSFRSSVPQQPTSGVSQGNHRLDNSLELFSLAMSSIRTVICWANCLHAAQREAGEHDYFHFSAGHVDQSAEIGWHEWNVLGANIKWLHVDLPVRRLRQQKHGL